MIVQSALSEYYHVVKVSNKVNDIVLAPLHGKEIDIFSVICYMMKNEKNKSVTITYEKFKAISGFRHVSNSKFTEFMKNLYQKIKMFEYYYSKNGTWECGWIFTTFKIFEDQKKVEIQVNDSFLSFFNDYDNVEYTIYYQEIMNNLKSKYSKIYLKYFTQRKNEGVAEQNYKDFLIYNGAEKMRSDNVDKIIINPVIKELSKFFVNLNCEKIKDGAGSKIISIKWTWKNTKGLAPEFDIERFKKFFESINVDMNYTIQIAIFKLLKTMTEEAVIKYFEQTWNTILEYPTSYVKNAQGLFYNTITKNKVLQPLKSKNNKSKTKMIELKSKNYSNNKKTEENIVPFYNKKEDPDWEEFKKLSKEKQELYWEKGLEMFNKEMGDNLITDSHNVFVRPYVLRLFKEKMF